MLGKKDLNLTWWETLTIQSITESEYQLIDFPFYQKIVRNGMPSGYTLSKSIKLHFLHINSIHIIFKQL